MSTADEIKKLKELLDEGVLSQEEFDSEKKKLLGNKKEIKNKPTKSQKEIKLEETLTNIKKSGNKFKEVDENKPIKEVSKISKLNWKHASPKNKRFRILVAGTFFIISALGIFSDSETSTSSNSSTSNSSASNSSASNSSASNSSTSNSSVCTNWANSTSKNANDFGGILGNSSKVLQNAVEGKTTYAEAINTLNSDVKKLKTIESRQKNLTPNSENEYSHQMFLLGVDSMIKGLEYAATGLETEYLPTLESGIELMTMGTEQVSKATDGIKSC